MLSPATNVLKTPSSSIILAWPAIQRYLIVSLALSIRLANNAQLDTMPVSMASLALIAQ